MKKIILGFFILGSLISYSFELDKGIEREIYNRGFVIDENKENLITFSNSKEKVKISFEKFDKNYIEKLKSKSNYVIEDTKKEKEEDEAVKFQSEHFIFKNTETGAKHTIINCMILLKNKKIEYTLEIMFEKGHENDFDGNTILDIPEKEFVRRVENLIEVNDRYIGLLEEEFYDTSYEYDGSDLALIKDKEHQAVGGYDDYYIDDNNAKKEGFVDKVDNFLGDIKKYKATKKPFLSKEISVENIRRDANGFIYDSRTGDLVSGVITQRDFNGIICYEQKVKDGLADGNYNTYFVNSDGERILQVSGKYKQGVKEGVWKSYYENGEKKEEAKYENGLLEGEYKSYYMNKKLKEEGEYEANQKTGKWIYYYQNGKKESEGKYDEDKKVKKWKYYKSNGKVREVKRHSIF